MFALWGISTVGKRRTTEERLIAKLTPYFEEKFPGEKLRFELIPARGFWRQTKADVMQFTGGVYIGTDSLTLGIGCWESMTDCLRFGFEISDNRGEFRSEADFVITAKDRSRDRSK